MRTRLSEAERSIGERVDWDSEEEKRDALAGPLMNVTDYSPLEVLAASLASKSAIRFFSGAA